MPDFNQAQQYAYQRLKNELPNNLYYHNLGHTFDDVLPAAIRIAKHLGINGADLNLIAVSATFHDIGFLKQRQGHEQIGIEIVKEALPDFGFSPEHISTICGMIQATQLPQAPQTLWESILADADLDVLGRDDFIPLNLALHRELSEHDGPITLETWYEQQIEFLSNHTYFTTAANELRNEGKKKNIAELQQRLNKIKVKTKIK